MQSQDGISNVVSLPYWFPGYGTGPTNVDYGLDHKADNLFRYGKMLAFEDDGKGGPASAIGNTALGLKISSGADGEIDVEDGWVSIKKLRVTSGPVTMPALSADSLAVSGTFSAGASVFAGSVNSGTSSIIGGDIIAGRLFCLGAASASSLAVGPGILSTSSTSPALMRSVNVESLLSSGSVSSGTNPMSCGSLSSGAISSGTFGISGGSIAGSSGNFSGTLAAGASTFAGVVSSGTYALSGGSVSGSSGNFSGTLAAGASTFAGAVSSGTYALSGGAASVSSLTSSGLVTATNCVLTSITGSPNLYTTGTWTITVGDGTNNFTSGSNTGNYTRIGNMYFCFIYYTWSSKGSAAGTIRISMPATAAAIPRFVPAVGPVIGISFTNQLGANIDQSVSYARLTDLDTAGGAPTYLSHTSFATSGTLIMTAVFTA